MYLKIRCPGHLPFRNITKIETPDAALQKQKAKQVQIPQTKLRVLLKSEDRENIFNFVQLNYGKLLRYHR